MFNAQSFHQQHPQNLYFLGSANEAAIAEFGIPTTLFSSTTVRTKSASLAGLSHCVLKLAKYFQESEYQNLNKFPFMVIVLNFEEITPQPTQRELHYIETIYLEIYTRCQYFK